MSDGEQAPLGHEAQLVKANRWVQIGHTLLEAGPPRRVKGGALTSEVALAAR